MSRERLTYGSAWVRPVDVSQFDVVRVRGVWRQVIDTWDHDDELPVKSLGKNFAHVVKARCRGWDSGLFIVVRYLVEEESDGGDNDVDYWFVRMCDLVEVQVAVEKGAET